MLHYLDYIRSIKASSVVAAPINTMLLKHILAFSFIGDLNFSGDFGVDFDFDRDGERERFFASTSCPLSLLVIFSISTHFITLSTSSLLLRGSFDNSSLTAQNSRRYSPAKPRGVVTIINAFCC